MFSRYFVTLSHPLAWAGVVTPITTFSVSNACRCTAFSCGFAKRNNRNIKTNGHITSKPEVQKALTNGAFEWQEGSGSEAVSPVTTETLHLLQLLVFPMRVGVLLFHVASLKEIIEIFS
jgi:hypothetical protein